MMMNDKLFLDTNVLVYLVDLDASFHEKAEEIFSEVSQDHELWISRQVLREYAVVVSRLRDVAQPAQATEIFKDLQKWESLFSVADETASVTENLCMLIEKYFLNGKRIHDANIVATMMNQDIKKLLTWNISDFNKFEEVELIEI